MNFGDMLRKRGACPPALKSFGRFRTARAALNSFDPMRMDHRIHLRWLIGRELLDLKWNSEDGFSTGDVFALDEIVMMAASMAEFYDGEPDYRQKKLDRYYISQLSPDV